jgi:adenylate cyclase
MSSTRQLAAIMFTDIVGYTALMGIDEEKAFDLLRKNRQIQKPIILRYNGLWIKELGDGVLASFSNVTDAVLCAGSIQKATTGIDDLQLRIGIHLGDVVFENDDVFGDGVNIASRLLTLAQAGGICISESVHSNVSNKRGITTNFLREEILKNVKEPVRIYEVSVDPSVISESNVETKHSSQQDGISEKTVRIHEKSIAVLPFVNMSNDPEQEYFSDGITEEILNSLTHVKDLRVAGRTSSFHFKGKNIDLRKIGQKLNVKTVLEGSIRKQGNKLRITAQLINVEDGFHFWSERYDREMDDIFAIQDEIAFAITEKLKITLLEEEKANIYKNPTENKDAYDLYLKGRFYFNKRGPGIIKGLEYFQQALEKDPVFALAYTGMAEAYCILALYCVVPPHDAMPKARQFAEKAIQLQSSYAEAYTTLAFITAFYDWNWTDAKKLFQRVFEINPNYAPAYYWYSYYLSYIERKNEEAINVARKAAEILEPLMPVSHHILSIMYINAGRFEDGLQASKMAIELDANSYPGYRGLGISLAGLNKNEEAIEAFKTAVLISSRQLLPLVELCWVYSFSDRTTEIENIMEELLMRSKTEYISALFLCCVSYYSKNYEKAIEYLELAFEQRDTTLLGIQASPITQFIRTEPRFQPYLKRMKFPE